jgi:hypothetical protein
MAETPEEQAAREAEEAKAAEEAAAAAAEGEGGEEEEEEEEGKGKPKGKFSQDDMEKAISKRLTRERKKWEKDAEEAKKKAEMSESDKLKAEKEEAEKKATEAHGHAAQMLIKADAKVAAINAGVAAKHVDKFLRLVDLSEVELNDKGDPDKAAIKAAIESELEDSPMFKAEEGAAGASGGDFGGSAGKKKWTQAEVDKLSEAEYEKHREEIMAQGRTGTMK